LSICGNFLFENCQVKVKVEGQVKVKNCQVYVEVKVKEKPWNPFIFYFQL
jgi:hypothetical protein